MEISIGYDRVLEFAKKAHKNQKRKYTDDDYINHPIKVAEMVNTGLGDSNMIAAALLHDVLEDTEVTHSELRAFLHTVFSVESAEDILKLVVELTDVYTKENFPDYNRKERKTFETLRLAYISDRAKAIKIADMNHNSESIEKYDPKFAKVFLEEKRELMKYLVS